ncbi:MAG: hypothetical protein ACOY6K_06825 [Pseudomonadota bacterium]
MNDNRWSRIEREITATKSESDSTHVSVVWNESDEHAARVDYTSHSILTEYLSDAEKSDFTTGLRDVGVEVDVFEGERSFIAAVLSGEWDSIRAKNKYVFNTTGSGTGRARTSLIPAFCDLSQISLCSADGLSAAVLEQKFYAFRILETFGLPIPKTHLFDRIEGWITMPPPHGTKVISKPSRECASIGVDPSSVFIYDESKDAELLAKSICFMQPILVQQFIPGYEVEVPIIPTPAATAPTAVGVKLEDDRLLGDAILTNEKIERENYSFYDFAELDEYLSNEIKSIAERAYRNLRITGLSRVDFRVTAEGTPFITDFNTPPHLTLHSAFWFAFQLRGLRYQDLMASLISVGRLNLKNSTKSVDR